MDWYICYRSQVLKITLGGVLNYPNLTFNLASILVGYLDLFIHDCLRWIHLLYYSAPCIIPQIG
jgi:hypothetical protein